MLFVLLGYFFGNIPIVKKYFSLVVVVIIIISVLPIFYQVLKVRMEKHADVKH